MNEADIYKAAGILIRDGKLLVEHSTGKDFFLAPGGKLMSGETSEQALVRELKEEFQIDVAQDDLVPFGTFSAEAAGQPGKQVHMEVFIVKVWRGVPTPDNEVEEIRWITSDIPTDMKLGSIFEHEVVPRLKQKGMIA